MGKRTRVVTSFVVFWGIMVAMFPLPVNNNIVARGNDEKYISEVKIEATSANSWSDEGKYNSTFYNNLKAAYKDSYNTEANPLEISNAGELAAFSIFVNTPSENGEPEHNFEGKFVKLMSDIDLDGTIPNISETSPDANKKVTVTISNPANKQSGLENVWRPIGIYAENDHLGTNRPFKGHFEGNNKKVSNMVVFLDTGMISGNNIDLGIGLFGTTDSAEIKNISIEGSSFVILKASVGSGVIFSSISGGIAGSLKGCSKVSNCHAKGIRVYNSAEHFDDTATNSRYAGGIAGISNNNAATAENVSIIENSSSQGGIICIGGKSTQSNAGGIVGNAGDTNIIDSHSNTDIYSYSSKTSIGGGIVGEKRLTSDTSPLTIVKNCYSTGNIYSLGESGAYSGGLAGKIDGSIQSSYSTGDVYTKSNGTIRSGGLVGALMGTYRNTEIIKNYSSSNVYSGVLSNGSTGAILHCGGLAGYVLSPKSVAVRYNYSIGNTYSSFTNEIRSGGLIGTSTGNVTVELNYSVSNVFTSSTAGKVNKGGINGYATGTLSNNFYNTEASGLKLAVGGTGTSGKDYETNNLGLTTMEMTGVGTGRASEKMQNIIDEASAPWKFNQDSVEPQRFYYPSLLGVSAELPYYAVIKPDTLDIKGWQTSLEDHYQARVTWGQMTFVYDKGEYDSNNIELKRKTTDEEYSGVEAGADNGTVNKWYGFDGTNNKVKIENLSTNQVKSTVVLSSDVPADIMGETSLQLYFKSEGSTENWKCESNNSELPSNLDKVAHAGEGEQMKTYGKEKNIVCTIPAKSFKEDGTESDPSNAANSEEFFLNITGMPGTNFSNDNFNSETLGKITVNFTK